MKKTLLSFFRAVLKLLKSSKACRALLIDNKNAQEFSNIYEHEKMLADEVRVSSYQSAIERNVKPGEVIVDLGTGTGILSFFAARQRPRKIYAIDHSEFIEVARKIAEHNNIDNVQFVHTNSRDFTPEEKVDVIVHEQIGDHLFDENMVENVLDLKQRTLKKTGRIIPGRFELYLEPVSIRDEYKVPFIWENNIANIDLGFLKHLDGIDAYKPDDYAKDWLEPSALESFLCEPESFLTFDLNELKDQNDLPRTFFASRKVVHAGPLDGFCFYFRVIFDDKLDFDTSPAHTNTHWGNCLFRVERRGLTFGDVISYRFSMEDIVDSRTWSVELMEEMPVSRSGKAG